MVVEGGEKGRGLGSEGGKVESKYVTSSAMDYWSCKSYNILTSE